MTPTQDDRGPTTTSGHIAVANLNAQVIGLTAQLDRTRSAQGGTALLTATGAAPLVDLLLLRGQVLGRVADYERAAELAGARDALREQIGVFLPPVYPAGYTRTLETARAALGPAAFDAAHARLANVPPPQIIATVMTGLAAPPNHS